MVTEAWGSPSRTRNVISALSLTRSPFGLMARGSRRTSSTRSGVAGSQHEDRCRQRRGEEDHEQDGRACGPHRRPTPDVLTSCRPRRRWIRRGPARRSRLPRPRRPARWAWRSIGCTGTPPSLVDSRRAAPCDPGSKRTTVCSTGSGNVVDRPKRELVGLTSSLRPCRPGPAAVVPFSTATVVSPGSMRDWRPPSSRPRAAAGPEDAAHREDERADADRRQPPRLHDRVAEAAPARVRLAALRAPSSPARARAARWSRARPRRAQLGLDGGELPGKDPRSPSPPGRAAARWPARPRAGDRARVSIQATSRFRSRRCER